MPELIDRHALLKKVYEHTQERERMTDGEWCRKCIYEAPKVDAEPVRHGRLETIDPSFAHVYCSECGAAADKYLAKRYKGCPFCLCVMDATDTNVGDIGGADNAESD